MKKLAFLLLFLSALVAGGQTYRNEWIDYTKTYYKFKVPVNGLYRITQPVLTAAGLGNTPAEQFQLWRNGQQVPVYTTVATGVLGASDYIEFWGEGNDGRPDKDLYRVPDHQLNDRVSLETDTASYFLTVNASGGNLRLRPATNNLPTALQPEPYFLHTVGRYYRERIFNGTGVVVGSVLYSSDYEGGEGYTSNDIGLGATRTENLGSLFPYLGPGAPDPVIRVNASGNALNTRTFEVSLNGSVAGTQTMNYYDHVKASFTLPLSVLSSGTGVLAVKNNATVGPDRMVIAQSEVVYARQFNFGGANNFLFELPASATENYLVITGFNYGTSAPVLLDLTNGFRYVADITNAPQVRIVLQPSSTSRRLLLVTAESSYPVAVTSLQQRNFINYSLPANRGDYLIVSHPALTTKTGGGNPVEEYRAYRASAAGGGYSARVYMIDQLIDQFAYGIKDHPLSVRNFLRWARASFPQTIKGVFLIGKGLHYVHNRGFESNANIQRLSFIPTFGFPASDNLLTADPGPDVTPRIPIGRLSVINGDEVALYLRKMIQYDEKLALSSPLIRDKGWQKEVVHVMGAWDEPLATILTTAMGGYETTLTDTLYGAHVNNFSKKTNAPVEQVNITRLYSLFESGISLMTYFGHSSASTLEFNLDNPLGYNNAGKYPLFILLGCNAGNFYNFNLARLSTKETISENFVLADQRGSIGCIASTSLGVPYYLDVLNAAFTKAMTGNRYGATLGDVMVEAIVQTYMLTTQNDFYARIHCEQNSLHGDPAMRLHASFPKPDYAIEDPMVEIDPSFISVAENDFTVRARFMNIGKAISRPLVVEFKRTFPDQTTLIRRDTLPGIRYMDSISYTLPILATRDKGANRISITIDPDNAIDELYETNNTVSRDVFIYEDELRPVYPFNLGIVNRQGIRFHASTANPFSAPRPYIMELDTTELFNSAFKRSQTITSAGGMIEFSPTVTFADSVVYYWRVAPVPTTGNPVWNTASFVYLPQAGPGFGQSHYFQHLRSLQQTLYLRNDRKWVFDSAFQNLFARNAIFPEGGTQQSNYIVAVNGNSFIGGGCNYNAIIFNVFDPATLAPWRNQFSGGGGLYGSLLQSCGPNRTYNFEFLYTDTLWRRRIMNFLNNVVPAGFYVIARGNIPSSIPNPPQFANTWQNDTTFFGSGNSLYHVLKNQGFAILDSFNRPRTFIFGFKKNDPVTFRPQYTMTQTIFDVVTLNMDVKTAGISGSVTSPLFGRAKAWKRIRSTGTIAPDAPGADSSRLDLIGVNDLGQETLLLSGLSPTQLDQDISGISASQYPFVKLRLFARDTVNLTPYQLRYWQVTYDPVPEGAIAPNLHLSVKDTVDIGEPVNYSFGFKNISETTFDSLQVKLVITDRNNVPIVIPIPRRRPLPAGDTLRLGTLIRTENLPGRNTVFLEANPSPGQPEQFHFNNFAYRNLYVRPDTIQPVMDVTFDGMHILNRDIVSSKPEILVKLKDEARWMILDDTSLLTLQVRHPDGNLRRYYFNNDTLRFIPAGQAPNTDNTASLQFRPRFLKDGEYELVITGKDKSANTAGNLEYKVIFQVVNTPMISNLLNYPNPFTTSTAFVFTLTGSEIPQQLKIEILTVTGRVVREITRDELGPLRIGRNLTEFKWDGTDQYGQKLANGVYLYRVVTNLNGKSLEKYRPQGDNTDAFFNKGYGKMYLMR